MAETPRSDVVVPKSVQPTLPIERMIVPEAPGEDAVPMDVLFVGAGPAGLAGAIHLARLVKKDQEAGGSIGDVEIGVLEKAEGLGHHSLSGAVVNPVALRALFPELSDADLPLRKPVTAERVYVLTSGRAWRIPTPRTMKNHGYFTASLCEVVRWLGEKAEGLGVNLFTGFPVASLLVEKDAVVGVRTTPSGLRRDGTPGPGHQPPTDVSARVVAIADGSRGSLSQAWRAWQGVTSENPQIFALGVKEVWETKRPLDAVIHTMGWPLPRDAFGGSFLYPLADDQVALGLVVGMDWPTTAIDVHGLLQRWKRHPLVQPILEGGELLEWGAKTIPEGGYYALPNRLAGAGALLLGDGAGFVDVPSLKGVHYAMTSGMEAAEAIFEALKKGDVSAEALAPYDERMRASYVVSDLRRTRNMRLAFQKGFFRGGIRASVLSLTKGAFPGRRIRSEEDALRPRRVVAPVAPAAEGALAISKVEGVFKSGNQTRDDIPSHLVTGPKVPPEVAELYAAMCPAGVYERRGDDLVVNAPNCVDCKATDVLGPRWTPREGGSGPHYTRM